jgi:hypothetical protein
MLASPIEWEANFEQSPAAALAFGFDFYFRIGRSVKKIMRRARLQQLPVPKSVPKTYLFILDLLRTDF